MKQIAVNVNDPPSSILLGRQGEHLATRVVFDCTDFAALYGEGSAELLHRREEEIYPVQTQRDGARVIWDITASDTASAGTGHAELRWMVGETVAKSAMFRTSVSAALSDEEPATPPLPYQSWVDAVLNAAQEIRDSAVTEEQLTAAIEAYLAENPIDTGLDESALAAYLTENGYLTDVALAKALADAADSGAFNGADGAPGADGADGGYYTPSVTQPTDTAMQVAFTASKSDMPAVEPVTVALPVTGGNETWELLQSVTLEEQATSFLISFPAGYRKYLVDILSLAPEAGSNSILYPVVHCGTSNNSLSFWDYYPGTKSERITAVFSELQHDGTAVIREWGARELSEETTKPANWRSSGLIYTGTSGNPVTGWSHITYQRSIPAGSWYKLWGVKA